MTTGAECPFHGFDPFRQEGMHEALTRARHEAPVFFDASLDAWVVTRYADVLAVFRDGQRFSARVALQPIATDPAIVGPILKAGHYRPVATNVDLDPPDHGRIRRIMVPLMGPRRIEQLTPAVERIVALALDRLPVSGRVDLVSALTYELPVRVLFALLGLPDDDILRVKAWARHFIGFVFGRPTAEAQAAAATGLMAWRDYCRDLVAARLANPGDDLVSDMVRAHQADPALLSVAEVAGYVQGLLVAGHETTTHQASNSIRLLLLEPVRWRALGEDPGLVKTAVEECLRMESSVVAWRRRAIVDVEVGGVMIRAGSIVLLSLASANRDEDQFPEPDEFRIDRVSTRPILSFGHGLHFCIGAPLARLELATLLEAMTRRFPAMRLVGHDTVYNESISFRGPTALWVEMA